VPEVTLPAHLEGNSGEVVFPGPPTVFWHGVLTA
jgi:hypothetical protein